MMTSVALGGRRARDPDDDVDTGVYVRPTMPWDRQMMLQIRQELGQAPPPRRVATIPARAAVRRAASARPNVFLTRLPSDPPPPWASQGKAALVVGKGLARARRAPRKTMLPWFAFGMCFLIAFGVGKDRALRDETASQLRAAVAQSVSVVRSSVTWLGLVALRTLA